MLDSRRVWLPSPKVVGSDRKTHLESRCCAISIYIMCDLLYGTPFEANSLSFSFHGPANAMGVKLLYSGFETCFPPST